MYRKSACKIIPQYTDSCILMVLKPEEEDDFNFAERFAALKNEFEEQLKEEERLNKLILENLEKIKIS